jgi:hypothetical protein
VRTIDAAGWKYNCSRHFSLPPFCGHLSARSKFQIQKNHLEVA